VVSAKVAMDRETGKSKGFGFVEMPNEVEAKDAIESLNDISLGKKPLIVKQAEDKPGGSSQGGGGYRGGSGGGGGYRGGSGGGGGYRGGGWRRQRQKTRSQRPKRQALLISPSKFIHKSSLLPIEAFYFFNFSSR
jgi:RNA recognition motif-containing protein